MISQWAHILRTWLAIAAVAMLLAACAGSPAVSTRDARSPASDAATVALQQVGVKYRYGGASPNGFDCSGLVNYAYASAGVAMPRTTAGLWETLQPVPRNDIERGDVLFFRIEGKVAHVGLYLGDGRFVHAPASGRTVSVASLDSDFYRAAYIRAGRLSY